MAADVKIDLSYLNRAYDASMFDEHRHLVLMGGAGSGKSYFAADKCILVALMFPGSRVGAFRKVARTIKRSVWALLIERLGFLGMTGRFDTNKTDFTIKLLNGSEIWCVGLDDQEKLKSIQGLSYVWLEEATEFTADDLTQVNLRLRGKTPGYKQILYTFNPISRKHHLKKRFFDTKDDAVKTMITTYKDNRYIDDEYKSQIEALKHVSENLWRIYAKGEWGSQVGLVYKSGFTFPDEWPEQYDDMFYGLDFGYNNPSALIEVGLWDGVVYLTERIYSKGLTTGDLIKEMNELEISKAHTIYADCAEPDRIEELNRAGFEAEPAYKGPRSVQDGIDFVQGITLNSKPENINLNAEMEAYAWRVDRDGEPMDEPVKSHDHAMDAMRYALYTHLGKPAEEIFTLDRSEIGF